MSIEQQETATPSTEPSKLDIVHTKEIAPPRRRSRRWIIAGVGGLGIVAAIFVGAPWIVRYFSTETTDDAFVNSYVTYVSPRVAGNVVEVRVDDNQFVEAGQVLLRLDAEPYRIVRDQKLAALDRAKLRIDQQVAALRAAEAEVEQARNQVRSQVVSLWSNLYLLQTIQSIVRYQEAGLKINLANEKLQHANLVLAEKEHGRYSELAPIGAAPQELLDQKIATLDVAKQQLAVSQENIKQTRALLMLSSGQKDTDDLKDIEETYPGVRYALANAQQTLTQLGIPFSLLDMHTSSIADRLAKLDVKSLVEQVPSVQMAQARLCQARAALGGSLFNSAKPYDHPDIVEAQRELDQAELNLGHTEIRAAISGYVNGRAVNPGTEVQTGQMVMAIRPLENVWIDANFKETQIDKLRIGLPVDIHVDAYPNHVFHGRIAGFSPGTGASLSLLPPQNATGNFVKIVQRLPVRIELTDPPSTEAPLFVGLSVSPEVNFKATPTGPDAGQRLLGRRTSPSDDKTNRQTAQAMAQ
jgi:membrane fusion protein, multidrug efflux system